MSRAKGRRCKVCGRHKNDHPFRHIFMPVPEVIIVWLWHEDDALVPDREVWAGAWERLFGVNAEHIKFDTFKDHGDAADLIELTTGRVVRHSYEGSSIGLLVDLSLTGRESMTDVTDSRIRPIRNSQFYTRWTLAKEGD